MSEFEIAMRLDRVRAFAFHAAKLARAIKGQWWSVPLPADANKAAMDTFEDNRAQAHRALDEAITQAINARDEP